MRIGMSWAAAWFAACGRGEIYAPCEAPTDCVVPEGATAACLDAGSDGFCTWDCATDADCVDDARPGWVCAPFEEDAGQHCFPSCEDATDGGDAATCPEGTACRSTGGGGDNRKVCFPESLSDAGTGAQRGAGPARP